MAVVSAGEGGGAGGTLRLIFLIGSCPTPTMGGVSLPSPLFLVIVSSLGGKHIKAFYSNKGRIGPGDIAQRGMVHSTTPDDLSSVLRPHMMVRHNRHLKVAVL